MDLQALQTETLGCKRRMAREAADSPTETLQKRPLLGSPRMIALQGLPLAPQARWRSLGARLWKCPEGLCCCRVPSGGGEGATDRKTAVSQRPVLGRQRSQDEAL